MSKKSNLSKNANPTAGQADGNLPRVARKLIRRGPAPRALEQRFMFDGAALADAVHVLTDSAADTSGVKAAAKAETPALSSALLAARDVVPAALAPADLLRLDTPVSSSPPSLLAAQAQAERLLAEFIAQSNASDQLFALFNGGQGERSEQWQQAADALVKSILDGQYSIKVEYLDNASMQGAMGAFAAKGPDGEPVIYLNKDWVQGGASTAEQTRVLLEEFGHSLDARLNGATDTGGDEGQKFAATVLGESTSASGLASDDDHATLQVEGEMVEVEMAKYHFVDAYEVYTPNTPAGKESNTHDFLYTPVKKDISVNDGNFSAKLFSGNDVSVTAVRIGTQTFYGWISRPIKVQGELVGFYFWTDNDFKDSDTDGNGTIDAGSGLLAAQTDGNQDGDSNVGDNQAFVLVVNQAYFDALTGTSITVGSDSYTLKNIGSSSDRVDTWLNKLLANDAPVAGADAGLATEAGVTVGSNATGNVLTNDTDADIYIDPQTSLSTGDTKTVTQVGTSSASTAVASGTNSTTGTSVTGQYGTLILGADGTYEYVVNNSNATVDALLSSASTLTDTFTYTMTDSEGVASTTTLAVTVQGANDAPTASNDYNTAKESVATVDNYTASDTTGSTAVGNVLNNDTDKDSGDGKTIAGITATATAGTLTSGTSATRLTFLAATTLSPVTAGAYVYISIGGVQTRLNDSAGNHLQIVTKTLVANTTDSYDITLTGSPHSYGNPASPTLITSPTTDLDNIVGTDTAGFSSKSVNSGPSGLKTATLSAINSVTSTDLPVSGISGTIAAGMSVTWSGYGGTPVTVSDVTYDASGNVTAISLSRLTAISAAELSNGTALQFTGSAGSSLTGQYGSLQLNVDGTYVYTPFIDNTNLDAGQTAVDSFTYTMQDTAGAKSSAILAITVTGSDAAFTSPNAVADTNVATEAGGATNTGGVNPEGNVILGSISVPAAGTGGAADTADTKLISAETSGGAPGTLHTATAGTGGCQATCRL